MTPPLNIAGTWVAVTGASSGLGRAAALCLADTYKAKPILIGRRTDSLTELQSEIDLRFGIESAIVIADQGSEAGRAEIAGTIEHLRATAALLGAGMTSSGLFTEDRMTDYDELLRTNVVGFTDLLARIVGIFERQQAPSGILAISSLGAETSLPYQAVYGASKAYINALVQALTVELASGNVTVGTFLPGGIDTPMAAKSSLRWGRIGLMDVDRCAAFAIDALVRRKRITVPGWGNKLAYLASRTLPRSVIGRAATLPYQQPR